MQIVDAEPSNDFFYITTDPDSQGSNVGVIRVKSVSGGELNNVQM